MLMVMGRPPLLLLLLLVVFALGHEYPTGPAPCGIGRIGSIASSTGSAAACTSDLKEKVVGGPGGALLCYSAVPKLGFSESVTGLESIVAGGTCSPGYELVPALNGSSIYCFKRGGDAGLVGLSFVSGACPAGHDLQASAGDVQLCSQAASCESPHIETFFEVGPLLVYLVWGITVVTVLAYSVQRAWLSHQKGPKFRSASFGRRGSSSLNGSEGGLELSMVATRIVELPDPKAKKRSKGANAHAEDVKIAVDAPEAEHSEGSLGALETFSIVGLRETVLGRAAVALLWTCTTLWLVLYLVLVVGYYDGCQFKSLYDAPCFYGRYSIFGSYDVNSKLFVGLWLVFLVWFGCLVAFAESLRSFFCVECEHGAASLVRIRSAVPSAGVATLYPSPAVRAFRTFQRWMRSRGGSNNCTLPDEIEIDDDAGGGDAGGGDAPGGGFVTSVIRVQRGARGAAYFEFQCVRFVLKEGAFQKHELPLPKTLAGLADPTFGAGLADHAADARLELVGPNRIPFEVSTVAQAAAHELFSFFYLYQLLIYSVWFWWSYLLVAAAQFTIVLASAATNMYLAISNQRTIHQMTSYVTPTEVRRSGAWVTLDSTALVPGDRVRARDDWVLPCDVVVVKGTAVCDESGLTGESKPVRKVQLPTPTGGASPTYDPLHGGSKHTLFSGTKTLQAAGVEGVVVATGTSTMKGELITSILFPKPMLFKYDEELPLAIAALFGYALVCFCLVFYLLSNNGAATEFATMCFYGIFTISQVLSPLLPIALTAGQVMASRRLAALGVFCLNPKRIAISGKVRLFCFDKTGTLTKDGLDFIGVHRGAGAQMAPAHASLAEAAAADADADAADAERRRDTLRGLACCHALTSLAASRSACKLRACVCMHGDLLWFVVVECRDLNLHLPISAFRQDGTLVGNEVEVRMFKATGWTQAEDGAASGATVTSPEGADSLRILKRFEFDHKRMTMSVVVRDARTGEAFVFCKGSAEKIRALCVPASVPRGYDAAARAHAMRGCYVLSLACRRLGKEEATDARVAKMARGAAERALQWRSLLLFRNELKPDTAAAIADLKAGHVRPVMITGDNAQCGYYIARQCAMLPAERAVLLGDVSGPRGEIVWGDMEQAGADGKGGAAAPTTDELLHGAAWANAELAVTGATFEALVAAKQMRGLLLRTRIFARMSPEAKMLAVDLFIEKGLVVGMCGDGGNDCGALRTAHAGVALSEAEASVVSPFTSKSKSVRSVVDLLREGRGSLVTSFAGYKFLITYGQLFSVVKLICLALGTIMANMDYIFIDVVIVLCLTYALTLSFPKSELGPPRPTSSLLGPVTLGSVLGMQLIHLVFLGLGFALIHSDPAFIPFPSSFSEGRSFWLLGDSWETTLLFTMFAGQFMTAGVIFTFGGEFRRPVWRNPTLVLAWSVGFALLSALILSEENALTRPFHMASENFNAEGTTSVVWRGYQACHADPGCDGGGPPTDMTMGFRTRFGIWALMVTSSVVAALWEKVCVTGAVHAYIRRRYPSARPRFEL